MAQYAIDIRQLKKVYSTGLMALKGISMTVESGDFFGLLGANGAGKSTTIGLITTLLKKTEGQIFIYGHDLDTASEQAKSCLGLVPQEVNLNIFETPTQILINQAGYYGISRAQAKIRAHELLEQVGLIDKRNDIVLRLSGGMKRRLMIARGLIHSPKVLILDEPTAGVDVEIRRSMWAFLKTINAQGTTIILTTHYLEEAEYLCKNIAIIDKGEIIKHSSTKNLLQTLHHQTFVFDTLEPLDQLPDLYPIEAKRMDSHSLELRINQDITLNEVYEILSRHNIKIQSMRNKTNRLEELFMDLVNHDH